MLSRGKNGTIAVLLLWPVIPVCTLSVDLSCEIWTVQTAWKGSKTVSRLSISERFDWRSFFIKEGFSRYLNSFKGAAADVLNRKCQGCDED